MKEIKLKALGLGENCILDKSQPKKYLESLLQCLAVVLQQIVNPVRLCLALVVNLIADMRNVIVASLANVEVTPHNPLLMIQEVEAVPKGVVAQVIAI